jgi:hypothetical protein
MREPEPYTIFLDVDRTRIRDILKEAYRTCQEILKVEFFISMEDFVAQIEPFLSSNRVSTAIHLHLPSSRYPEMLVEVSIRKKSVIIRMNDRNKRIYLNRVLSNL